MAEKPDRESKTEQPTEKKIRDEMERGNLPASREVATFTFMIGLLLIFSFFLNDGVFKLANALSLLINHANSIQLNTGGDLVALCRALLMASAPLLVPIFIILICAGIVASIVQNAPRIVFERLKPDFSRISLMEGWH